MSLVFLYLLLQLSATGSLPRNGVVLQHKVLFLYISSLTTTQQRRILASPSPPRPLSFPPEYKTGRTQEESRKMMCRKAAMGWGDSHAALFSSCFRNDIGLRTSTVCCPPAAGPFLLEIVVVVVQPDLSLSLLFALAVRVRRCSPPPLVLAIFLALSSREKPPSTATTMNDVTDEEATGGGGVKMKP